MSGPSIRKLTMGILAICVIAGGCKEKPRVYACIAKSGATCDERYGETQEDADALCTSSHTFQVGTCPTRNLIGRCERTTPTSGKETYLVESYYLPMQEGWDVNRLQAFCARAKGYWLTPGDSLSMVPSKLVP